LNSAGIGVCLWSVTSYVELSRDIQAVHRRNRLHPLAEPELPYVEQLFKPERGAFVVVSDYQKSLSAAVVPFLPGPVEVLGTDGYGLSEDRADLRNHFEVSAWYIVQAALSALYRGGDIDAEALSGLMSQLALPLDKPDPAFRQTV
jgi:pyruvate dehydrogenase E1 component